MSLYIISTDVILLCAIFTNSQNYFCLFMCYVQIHKNNLIELLYFFMMSFIDTKHTNIFYVLYSTLFAIEHFVHEYVL